MKLRELFEDTENFDITIEGSWETRVFIEAKLKASKKTWLDIGEKSIVECTVDIHNDHARINHIIVSRKGKGYGGEVIKWIHSELKKHGVKTVEAYIEHINVASRSMFTKLGYDIAKKDKQGDYWEFDL